MPGARIALIGNQLEHGKRMKRNLLLSLAGASAAIVIGLATAQAAPSSSVGDALRSTAQNQSVVQDVHWRRYRHCHRVCRWHRGCHRVCHGGRHHHRY